jgi:3-methyladenine DNA glycosylase AlkC
MSKFPALKHTFKKNWLATWLNDPSILPVDENDWELLSLKERTIVLAHQLHRWLPAKQMDKKLSLIEELIKTNKPWNSGDMLYWPIFSWVEIFANDCPDQALVFLAKYTHVFTAEFAIRPLIVRHEEKVFEFLSSKLSHPDEHVRRWISEGTRPRLPWGLGVPSLKNNLERNLQLITPLIHDSSIYVRKSVGNHLNDLYREDPALAMEYATKWKKNNTPESNWVVKHGLRSAVKDGFLPALLLLGFEPVEMKQAECTIVEKTIPFHGDVLFHISGKFDKPSDVILDYAINFVRANGKSNRKVFKLKVLSNVSDFKMDKKHRFKPISTRKYYPGMHTIEILANGETIATETFELKKP